MNNWLTAKSAGCSLCPRLCAARGMIVDGAGSRSPALMIVAEAPGPDEDRQGVPFVGQSGVKIRSTVSEAGIHNSRIYVTNAVKCWPGKGNPDPTKEELENCLPWLEEEIRLLQPVMIMCLGRFATKQVAEVFKSNPSIPMPIIVNHVHPAAVLRAPAKYPEWREQVIRSLEPIANWKLVRHEYKPEPWQEVTFVGPSEWLAVDTETDNLEEDWGSEMVTFQISDGYDVALYKADTKFNSNRHIFAHNIKYDAPHLGIDLHKFDLWDDTGLMAYVLRYDRVGLKILGPELTGIEMEPISSILKYRQETTRTLKNGTVKVSTRWAQRSFSQALRDDPEKARNYAIKDPVVTSRIARKLTLELGQPGNERLHYYYHNIEKPLVPILLAMEQNGVLINEAALKPLSDELKVEIETWEERVRWLLNQGPEFNPNSTDQLVAAMLKSGYTLKDTTPKGKLQVDKPVLLKLEKVASVEDLDEDSLSWAVLEMRRNRKLKTTYVDTLLEQRDREGRIHCSFNQMVAGTNRLSSSDPNLQNIPIRGTIGKTLRRVFVAPPGQVIVKVDASQLEVRIFAHYTNDPTLTNAYLHTDHNTLGAAGACTKCDVHQGVATALEIPRFRAKNTLFARVYGAADEKLAQTAGVELHEVAAFMARLRDTMPCLVTWPKWVEQMLIRQGYIETLMGWRNYYPGYWSAVKSESKAALREAANMPIQGTASGIIKWFMIRADAIARKYWANALLQVHDEMVYEIAEEFATEFCHELAALFAQIGRDLKLRVPLLLNCEVGPNWGDGVEIC